MKGKGGSYNGGSTTIGPGSKGWFGNGGVTSRLPINSGKTGGKKARAAAIARHEQALRIERYAALAQSLRDAGFTEAEIKRGLSLQRAKDATARKAADGKGDKSP
ncbi:hypothetical protein [Novosphingobium sp. SG720]|uniref:hypothetical protein n=1 Tax=Novosphingobium sp. SG720 TaxID=2586998 RepID=UPI0014453260|nr:hypothetical protein [Novosphingobium sp. SG720]NKJ42508.1 hypothetical protein [Novosphingobium sp. SG720]